MATWLILGGVIPLAVILMTQHDPKAALSTLLLPERYPYILAAIMGFLSLLVRRAGVIWRIIIALGAFGIAAALVLTFLSTGGIEPWNAGWASGMLWMVLRQYHLDMQERIIIR